MDIKEINLPDLGEGIEGAEVSDVMVSAGQSISKNDILLVLESDKSSMEIPSDYSGTVVEVFVNSGEEVSTGQKLMTIETDESLVEKQSKKDKEVESKTRTEKIVLPDPFNCRSYLSPSFEIISPNRTALPSPS